MFYNFELQILGVILLPAMLIGCIFLWLKRRKTNQGLSNDENDGS